MSNLFLMNLFLAAGFCAVLGQLNVSGFLAGFAIGYLALWITRPLYEPTLYFAKVSNILRLLGYFAWQLIVSNFRVLWDVVTPGHISRPGIIGVPLDAKSDFEIMLVANLVSLTPGTLTLDISADRKILYVHVMFLDDVEAMRLQIKKGIEQRVLEAVR